MQSDIYTRIILTVIALCLIGLVARSYRADGAGDAERRFQILNVRLGRSPAVLRFDTGSGQTWRIENRASGMGWSEIDELADDEQPAAAGGRPRGAEAGPAPGRPGAAEE